MASIVISDGQVDSVRLVYLYRKHYVPCWDNRKQRSRSQRRLNFCVRLPDGIYGLLYGWEKLYQRIIVSALQFVKRSGGIIPSLFRIRKRHLRKIVGVMTGPFKRTAEDRAARSPHEKL